MYFKSKNIFRSIGLVVSSLTPLVLGASTPTTTAFTISPSGPVAEGTVLTLSASVAANGSAVRRGLVLFCNAAAAHCTDVAVTGQAQLTSSGIAKIKVRLGVGAHSIRAVFEGTTLLAPSPSASESVTVTGTYKSDLSGGAQGAGGSYNLLATLNAIGPFSPVGTLSWTDTNHGNALLASEAVAATGAVPSLILASDTPSGSPPFAVAAGDFNGDGIPDVACLNRSRPSTPIIFLGNGDGTFTQKLAPSIGPVGVAIAAADFNGDGILDLVAISDLGQNLTVLLGNGDGTFFTGTSVETPDFFPDHIGIGDFNGDGVPDLAVLGPSSGTQTETILILLGKGDGSFTAEPAMFDVDARGIAVADLNGDGLADLAILNIGSPGNVAALLSNGNGTFTTKATTVLANSVALPLVSAAGDFNRDGNMDLVVGGLGDFDRLLSGNGDGTFTVTVLPSYSSYVIGVGDFNGDGIPDLVSGQLDVQFAFVYTGNGDGTFTYRSMTSLGPSGFAGLANSPQGLTLADFNGDGFSDVAFGLHDGSANVLPVLFGGFSASASFPIALGPGTHAIVASYTGDGNYPSATAQSFNVIVPAETPTPVLSPGPGLYQSTQSVQITDAASGAAIYYTLDGSIPTASSAKYTAPIVVGWAATIKAIAVETLLSPSAVATGVYSIDRPLPSPAFGLASGTYSAPQSVSVSLNSPYCQVDTCTLYYTVNSNFPTEQSAKYTGPILLNQTGTFTIKVLAVAHHFTSRGSAASYHIQ